MTNEPISPWWQRRAVLAAILLAAIVPLLWPQMPPLTDLPGHAARWHIAQAGPDSPLARYYAIEWRWVGNLGADLIALPLVPLVGTIMAAKLVAILIMLLTVAGLLLLAREAHGRVPPTALFALPFAYGWPFQMGFVNFALSQALGLLALALWVRLGRTDRLLPRALLAPAIGLIVWTSHSAGWGLFGLMAFGAELALRRGRGDGWLAAIGRAVLACLPLALPLLVMLLGHSNDPRASDTGDWFNMGAKFLWFVSSLRDRWDWFDIGALLPLLFLLYVAARDRRLGYSALLGWPALFALAGFLVLPRLLLGGSYVDMRMMPAIWMLALLAIRPPPPGRFARGLAILGLAFFAVRTAATTASFVLTANEQRAELAALDAIPHGSPVLALVYKPCRNPWSDVRGEHLPGHATIARDAFTNEQWAIDGQQFLSVRYKNAAPFDADPSQLVYPVGCKEQGHSLAHSIAHFPRAAFRYVWMIDYRIADPRHFGLRSVWTNGHSALYEVQGATKNAGVEARR